MIETDKYGYYHATNEGGYISWYDFTKEIFRQATVLGLHEYKRICTFSGHYRRVWPIQGSPPV